MCNCNVGYAQNDQSADCININECIDETDDCSENELCFDTVGSYQCNSVPSKFLFPTQLQAKHKM